MDFEKLYDVYYMQVYSYVMTILKNSQLAEEMTQEVFFKALKSSSYKGKSNEFTWLCAIAKNTCFDHLKESGKYGAEPNEELEDSFSIEKAVEDEQMTFLIHQHLHEMEEPYKEVFQLRIFGELSFEKIGRLFGKTENWARVTYHRAKLKLQDSMKKIEGKI